MVILYNYSTRWRIKLTFYECQQCTFLWPGVRSCSMFLASLWLLNTDITSKGMYLMHMGSPCTYRTLELTNFTKNLKTFTHVLSVLLHLCIKFQVKTHYSLSIIKREISDRFLTTYLSEILSFLLLLRY
jgi:hypothetical protein